MNFITLFGLCPESFFFTFCIVGNYLVGCVQDILCRTVILLQPYHLRLSENLLKAQDVPDICSTETINRLVIIANYAEILVFFRKKTYEFKLCGVSILILIHHNIPETFLIIIQDIRIVLEKLHGFHDQVIKIQGVVSPEDGLVFLIHACNLPCIRITSRIQLHLFRRDQLILGMGNLRKNSAFFINFCIDTEFPEDFPHDCLLVVGIIDGKITAKSQHFNMSA